MDVLVLYESPLGHTRRIAQAIAAAMIDRARVALIPCRPNLPVADYDLIVLGAPTHHGRLPTPASRAEALVRAGQVGPTNFGLREWLAEAPVLGPRTKLAVFDLLPPRQPLSRGSAARQAFRVLQRRYGRAPLPPRSFLMAAPEGPLHRGELRYAAHWGAWLAASGQADTQAPDDPRSPLRNRQDH